MQLRNLMAGTLAGIALACANVADAKSDFPDHVIRLVVPQSAGSGGDLTARILSDRLSSNLGQTVIIENRPGANGNIASSFVAKSAPDGYTLLLAGISQIAFNPYLYENLPYDPAKDFTYISPVIGSGFLLIASKASGITSFSDLLAKAKANPGRITYASAGPGNSTHLSTAMIAQTEGLELMHIPFNGSGPAMNAVVGSQIDLMASVLGTALPQAQAGNVVPLAVLGPDRVPELPNVPTLAETGSKAAAMDAWFALLGPAGMPPDVVGKLNKAMQDALHDPAISKKLRTSYLVPLTGTPEEMRRKAASDAKTWGNLIHQLAIKAN